MSLLANLSINVGFILSNFFDLGVKLLLFLESFNLSLDDGDFIFLLGDIFFLGFDDNLRDSDLLLDMLFVGLNLLKLLGGVGQLSSSSCLLSDGLLSGGSKSLNFLSVVDNGSGDLVNILLDLGLLSNGNNLDLVSEVLLLLNKRGSGRGDGIDLALDLGDGLGSRFDGRLKIGSLGSEGLHLGGNLSLLLLKGLFLLLNESSKFLLGLSGNGVGFLISLERLFLLMQDFLNKSVLNNLNLMLDVSHLMLNGSGLLGNLGLLDSLSLNLALNKGDSLFCFLGNTRSLLLLEFGLVDFSNLGGGDSLLLLLSEDLLGFLNKSRLFISLVFFNGGSLNLNLGNELRGLNLEVGAHLLVSLSLSWVF